MVRIRKKLKRKTEIGLEEPLVKKFLYSMDREIK